MVIGGEIPGKVDLKWQPLSPPPDQIYWLERFPVSSSRLGRAQEALQSMRAAQYELGVSNKYPWRLALSPATGLPYTLRIIQPLADDDQAAQATFFSTPGLSEALFGAPIFTGAEGDLLPDAAYRVNDPVQPAYFQARHLTWRQTYGGLPVIGGSVRVHGLVKDPRVLVTSSYFPVPDGPPPLAANSEITQSLIESRCLRAVMRVAPWNEAALALETLLFVFQLGSQDEIQRFLDLLAAEQPAVLMKLVEARMADHSQAHPHVSVTPVAVHGSRDAILPFGGRYHLSRRFGVSAPGADPWYVDIDMTTGDVLGSAWQAVALASDYFRTSAETAAAAPAGDLATLQGQGFSGAWLDGMLLNGSVLLSANVEDQTVAASAWRLKHYLVTTCGVLPSQLERADQPLAVEMRSAQQTAFAYDPARPRKLIRFQDDPGGGIAEGAQVIRTPARDPEVALHEFTHAYLWLIDAAPWDTPTTVNPFAKALHEGYAMYLSRSVQAALGATEAAEPWARAAYAPKNPDHSVNWGNRWAFGRATRTVGADLLPAPNIYPSGSYVPGDIRAYDVGMVWARALWDLRALVGNQEADWLVVQAYPYLHGYIANFGLAAEAILDVDIKRQGVNLANGIQPVWAGRGVAAGLGVRGFARTATTGRLIAAGPQGILAWNGAEWQLEERNLSPHETLTGVVAVIADGDTLYAAAELPTPALAGQGTQWRPGIYTRNAGGWSPLGNWVADTGGLSPLCLLVPVPGQLRVGTARGVYEWNGAGTWMPFGANGDFPALALAASGTTPVAISSGDLYVLRNTGWGRAATALFGGDDTIRLTGLVAWQGGLYVGSLTGLRRVVAGGAAQLVNADGAAVLALAGGNTTLFFATETGVSTLDSGGITPLHGQQHHLPPGAIVICLNPQPSGDLLAGTLMHGIWRFSGGNWFQMPTHADPFVLSLAAGERALLGLTHDGQQGVHVISGNPDVVLDGVFCPGFPLQVAPSPGAGIYDLAAGPVVLCLTATQATPVQAQVQVNGDIVII